MAATNLGTAYIKIAPQMQGIQQSISNGLAGIKSTSLPGATALGTVIAKGVSAAMNIVTNSLDDAIKRVDTLNNFPKIMKNLGINAEDAQASIDKMKKSLDGLPTTLQDGAKAVQRFTSKNNDVKKSTDMFLALNNAILAGGGSATEQQTALEQLTQAYAKGKPDMMEWRTASIAMSAQLSQVAEKMGFGKNAANQLGEALRKGEVSMDDFMDAIIDLNKNGINGLASFEQQAKDATAGIGTAMKNLHNRVVQAIERVIQAFGSKDISDAINKFSSSFNGIADWIADNVVPVIKRTLIPALKNIISVAKEIVEFVRKNQWVQTTLRVLLDTILAYKAVSTVKTAIVGLIGPIVQLAQQAAIATTTFKAASAAGLTFSTSMGAAAASTTGLTSVVTGAIAKVGALTASLGAAGLAGVAGIAAAAIIGYQEVIIAADMATVSATTAARLYKLQIHDTNTAVEKINKALGMEEGILNDLKNALSAQNNAELEYLEAKKTASEYEQEYNELKKSGTASTDDLRIAELKLAQAVADRTKKQEALNDATGEAKYREEELFGIRSVALRELNEQITKQEVLSGKYAIVANQLDNLAKSTITYKNANGEIVAATQEQTQQLATAIAENLRTYSTTWEQIYNTAVEEGISLTEATTRIGQQAGAGLVGQFALGVEAYKPLATEAADATAQEVLNQFMVEAAKNDENGEECVRAFAKGLRALGAEASAASYEVAADAIAEAKKATGNATSVGKNMIEGFQLGFLDSGAQTGFFGAIKRTIKNAIQAAKDAAAVHSPSRKTAEIGKFMVLGLAKGIDDYADEAVESAEEMASRTIEAMRQDGDFGLESNMNQVRPQTADTSGMIGSGGQVTQYNNFEVNSQLDVEEISKRLGWQVATAL